jgi:hypothetical protein
VQKAGIESESSWTSEEFEIFTNLYILQHSDKIELEDLERVKNLEFIIGLLT